MLVLFYGNYYNYELSYKDIFLAQHKVVFCTSITCVDMCVVYNSQIYHFIFNSLNIINRLQL